ncbi:hypothetical protein U0C82_15485 [Fulvimarina sp. 2208YS6-2-32]|uniref:Uncharacterized protein n=1 Tax=Fulvimarina uroteuthidis TaxID=3098149 RepID=A0ABU5I6V1_9HYPH|nr:hypothetical protein [Fulvimarina sp. 2208YS6-2-32]MDY8110544.1 hypothetical protein [Fulvimarina sp. 2208YS6-2-32]
MTEFEIKSRDLDEFDLTSPIAQLRSLLVRGSILFGVAVVAVALVVVPAIRGEGDTLSAMSGSNLDMMSTGSITSGGQSTTYRVQRSILQPDAAPCIFWPDGRQQGAC